VIAKVKHSYDDGGWYEMRVYTYVHPNGQTYTKHHEVLVPWPLSFRERFYPRHLNLDRFDQDANDAAAYSFLSAAIAGNPNPTEGISFGQYLNNAGIYPTKWMFDLNNRSVVVNPAFVDTPRFMLAPVLGGEDWTIQPNQPVSGASFIGEYLTRKRKKDFTFGMVADTDITLSQAADLTIFGERLVSALRR
jgi:hypothetical protein